MYLKITKKLTNVIKLLKLINKIKYSVYNRSNPDIRKVNHQQNPPFGGFFISGFFYFFTETHMVITARNTTSSAISLISTLTR